ncbi:MAG: TIGR03986 family CRISPR-associated RAMP protein [Lachnospiraceae bacterium]|nr:TIGR03986 family CRISPR-associated RAMP protein [Lachnospiraceae bacterium]
MQQNFDGDSLANAMMGNGLREEISKNKNRENYNSNKYSSGKPNNSGKNRNYNHGNFNKNHNNQNRNHQTSRYVGAPYNFVPFTSHVYEYPENKQLWHDDVSKELLTGEIEYEIIANTPIIIDDGKGNFYKTAYGTYAIPGSTVRGLVRNNVQILGLSSFSNDIDNYALMYRNVASGSDKERYDVILGSDQIPIENGDKVQKIGVLKNVKAGYIVNENGTYKIYQTVVDSINKDYGQMNYYTLSERKVIHEYLDTDDKKNFPYGFFIRNGKSIMQHTFKQRFEEKKIKGHYIGDRNKDYRPYFYPVSYEIANLKNVQAVGDPNQYSNSGFVISSGAMNEKKVIYIIPKIDKTKEAIHIPAKDVLSFKIDFEKKKNTLKRSKNIDFFNLPKEGEVKPVFYIQPDMDRLYFGFTPSLRLFYDHDIRYGLPVEHQKQVLDYSSAIFGYSADKKSFKSKVSFLDAETVEPPTKLDDNQVILEEPKPTSYLDYLIQDDEKKTFTYNSQDMRLRGIKQYWLHDKAHPQAVDENKKAVTIEFCPLKEGVRFTGKIRYKNLSPDELGLLLWGIQLEKGKSRMNIGKAKSFGYGNITMNIKSVKKLDKDKAYALDDLELNPFTEINVEEMIQKYKDHINRYLGSIQVDDLPSIRNFFLMKNQEVMPDEAAIQYMSINRKEYQNRKQPLKSIEDTICKIGQDNTNG